MTNSEIFRKAWTKDRSVANTKTVLSQVTNEIREMVDVLDQVSFLHARVIDREIDELKTLKKEILQWVEKHIPNAVL